MNPEILTSIGDAITWTFDAFLVPLGNTPNTIAILIGFVGLGVWLKMQGKYNQKAKEQGSLK